MQCPASYDVVTVSSFMAVVRYQGLLLCSATHPAFWQSLYGVFSRVQ
jgi:hypothetical protein